MKYLAVSDVMALHDYYVGLFGGILGVRDDRLLDSAVFRCQASFDGQDLYKTIFEKAAAFFHSIIFDHPFVDGNKRTALFGAKRFLYLNGYILEMTNKEAVAFPLFVEETRPGVLDIAEWLKDHSRKNKGWEEKTFLIPSALGKLVRKMLGEVLRHDRIHQTTDLGDSHRPLDFQKGSLNQSVKKEPRGFETPPNLRRVGPCRFRNGPSSRPNLYRESSKHRFSVLSRQKHQRKRCCQTSSFALFVTSSSLTFQFSDSVSAGWTVVADQS